MLVGVAALHLSGVWSSIESCPCASFPPSFISSAWLKSSNNQSVFLGAVPPTIPSIGLYFELWFSLWIDCFFQMDAEKPISWGSGANIIKRYGFEEHTLRSAWAGVCVCTTCFMIVFVSGLFTAQVGHCVLVSCCVFVCARKSQAEVDYWIIIDYWIMCVVSPFSCSLSLYVLVPLSLVDSRGAAVFPLQIIFLVSGRYPGTSLPGSARHVLARPRWCKLCATTTTLILLASSLPLFITLLFSLFLWSNV